MKIHVHPNNYILATLCAASLMGATAFAANPHHTLRERGTIESINANDSQLTVKDTHIGATQVFMWNQDTKFLEREHLFHKAKTVTPDDLKAGEKAVIRYEKEGDQLVATKVVITGEPSATTKATQYNHS